MCNLFGLCEKSVYGLFTRKSKMTAKIPAKTSISGLLFFFGEFQIYFHLVS